MDNLQAKLNSNYTGRLSNWLFFAFLCQVCHTQVKWLSGGYYIPSVLIYIYKPLNLSHRSINTSSSLVISSTLALLQNMFLRVNYITSLTHPCLVSWKISKQSFVLIKPCFCRPHMEHGTKKKKSFGVFCITLSNKLSWWQYLIKSACPCPINFLNQD